MPCIDSPRERMKGACCTALAFLAGCSAPAPAPAPVAQAPVSSTAGSGVAVAPALALAPAPASAAPSAQVAINLPPPAAQRNWNAVRRQAALRMVAASPTQSYMGASPAILLAIPVLEVELNGDGSVRRIEVLRRPGQAIDTVQLAMDAVRRGAPYGDVSRLPRPWKFVETFLFDDARRFKPRSLDL